MNLSHSDDDVCACRTPALGFLPFPVGGRGEAGTVWAVYHLYVLYQRLLSLAVQGRDLDRVHRYSQHYYRGLCREVAGSQQ